MNFYARPHIKLFAMSTTIAMAIFAFSITASSQTDQPSGASELVATSVAPSAPVESSSVSELPDAPSVTVLHAYAPAADRAIPRSNNMAPKYERRINYYETAQPVRAGDKVLIELRDIVSLENLAGDVIAGSYSHLTNGSPNYGTNSTAYGKRIGAAVARNAAEEVFSGAVLSPIMHMDPRYYVMGPERGYVPRGMYAITRVFVTRTDSGRETFNAPLILGYVGASALNNAYYPPINRNFKDTASEFGSSLGGAAIGFLFDEFSDDLLQAVHLKKKH